MLEFEVGIGGLDRVHRTKMMFRCIKLSKNKQRFSFLGSSKATYTPPSVPRQTNNAEASHKGPDCSPGEGRTRPGTSLCPKHRG